MPGIGPVVFLTDIPVAVERVQSHNQSGRLHLPDHHGRHVARLKIGFCLFHLFHLWGFLVRSLLPW